MRPLETRKNGEKRWWSEGGRRSALLRRTEAKCSPGRVEALAFERAALLVE